MPANHLKAGLIRRVILDCRGDQFEAIDPRGWFASNSGGLILERSQSGTFGVTCYCDPWQPRVMSVKPVDTLRKGLGVPDNASDTIHLA